MRDPWIAYTRPSAGAALRLFCFPYAGAGAGVYRDWVGACGVGVEVCPVQLPGRESRMLEAPLASMDELVHAAAAGLEPYLDRPFAFFGHSMGALLGFELARRLRASGAPLPLRLFASAYRAPHLPARRPAIHPLPDVEFLAALQGYGGTPAAVLGHADLVRLVLPGVRADFRVHETYRFRPEPPLLLPITSFAGRDDRVVAPDEVHAWRQHTQRTFDFHLLDGGHFFVHAAGEAIRSVVAAALSRAGPPVRLAR